MVSRIVAVLAIFAVFLAGCAQHGHTRPSTESSSPPSISPSPSPSQSPIPAPSNATQISGIELSNCTAFDSSTGPFPRAIAPGQAPPGWEPKAASSSMSYVFMLGYDCHRISVGPHERGPVRIIVDGHDNADTPTDCAANAPMGSSRIIISTLLISDRELASYLHTALGLPAINATIQNQTISNGASTWTWNVAGGSASKVMVVDNMVSASNDQSDRFYWQRGSGIGILDFKYTRQGPAYTNRAAYGNVQSPMLLASQPQGAFVASAADFYPSLDGTGTLHLYSDNQCKQPEPAPKGRE
jgi:hypothetical protein